MVAADLVLRSVVTCALALPSAPHAYAIPRQTSAAGAQNQAENHRPQAVKEPLLPLLLSSLAWCHKALTRLSVSAPSGPGKSGPEGLQG